MKKTATYRILLLTLFAFISSLSYGQNKQTFQSVKGILVRITPKLADIDPTSMYGQPFQIARDMNGLIGVSDRGEEIIEAQIRRSSRKGASLAMQNPNTIFPNTPIPTLGVNFDGQNWVGIDPSDNNIAVGPNHVIQMVNATSSSFFKIWDKTGAVVQNAMLLSAVTGLSGAGDPVVLYDQLSDRWVLSEFGPNSCCSQLIMAVSVTSNPTGAWKIYQYTDPTFFPDYPKFSVWHNAYYATTNDFNSAGTSYLGSSVWAFDRAAMIAGAATATMVRFRQTGAGNPFYNMGTVCLEGSTPSTQNGLFIYPDGASNLGIFEFTPNFANPPASVVGPVSFLPIAVYSQPPANVAQQGSGVTIGTLGSRMMFRMNFRNRGGTETIVATHTVRGATAALAAVRWYELRRVAGNWTVFQQGTLANADGNSRWMGGISMDDNGNIGLMYDLSGTTSFPSIKYTGRNLTDPLGAMTLAEQTIVNGTGPHTSSSRWGDYNTLVSDPSVPGSYWGTSEYSVHSTRVFNFSLSNGIPIPVITANTSALTAESCSPSNGFIDPNETVTVNLCLQNTGTLNTTNLVATLLPTGGVTAPSGPQNYGAVTFGGSAVCRNFTFTANGLCGGNVVATLQLQDGATNLGTITYNFTLGGLTASFTQNFDAVTVPALPAGWLATNLIAGGALWVTSNSGTPVPVAVSAPNSLFVDNAIILSDKVIETPSIPIVSAAAKLSFSNNYNSEPGWDGGVLEISINGAAYQDIITAGGTFISGGYSGVLGVGSSLANRSAWTGNSVGYITTNVNLPAAAAGQNIKLRFRFASDDNTAAEGWRIDNFTINEPTCCAGCSNVSIASQPANTTGCTGSNTTITVVAGGSTPTYQWQISTTGAGGPWTDLTNTAPYSGVTTATLTITGTPIGLNGNYYRAVVNNTCPSTVNSNGVLLTVSSPSSITGQPANTTICSGANASFTVAATGPSLAYQWQVSTTGAGGPWANLTNVAPYSNVTTATLNITGATPAMNGYQYRVLVSNCAGPLNSIPAILTVNTGVAITTQPANTSVCSSSSATFTVAASGSSPTYQWQVSTTGVGGPYTDLSNVAPYSGVTTATLTITGTTLAMSGNYYRAVASNSCPPAVNSNGALLSVSDAAAITSQPSNATICSGSNTSFVVAASGSSLTYKWQVSTTGAGGPWTDLTNVAPYSGVTTTTLLLTAPSAALSGNQYRAVVTSCSGALNSNPAILIVNTPVAITTQPTSQTVCEGVNVTFTSAATGTGLTYQWQISTTGIGGPWSNIGGQINPSLTLTAVTPAMNGNAYRVVVTGTCTPAGVISSVAILTVNSNVTISTQPVSIAVCAGQNASFTVTAAGTGLTYQWQISTNGGGTWINTGANTASLNLTAVTFAMNGNQYRVVLNGTCTSNLNSTVATLTVNLPVQINTQPASVSVCEGSSVNFSITTTSFPTGSPVTYQWQESINGGAFINIVNGTPYLGTTTPTLTVNPTSINLSGRNYRVIATGQSCGSTTSNVAILTVNALPAPVLTLASYPGITPYIRTGLYVTVSPVGSYTYQWYKNNILLTTRTSSFFDANVDDFGEYYVVVTNPVTGCFNSTNRVTLKDSASNILFIIPNPSTGIFTVSYHTLTTGIVRSLNVYDAKGARVFTSSYPISRFYEKMEVNLKNAASGVYLVELIDSKGVRIATGKVVIKR